MDVAELLLQNLQTSVGLATIALLAPFELVAPRVAPGADWSRRLATVSILAAASLFMAYFASEALFGDLMSLYSPAHVYSIAKAPLHPVLIFILSFLFVDLTNYTLHVLSHKIRLLWKLHAIHHADEHVAASTALLHHPLEVLFHYAMALFVYVVIGVPVLVVSIYGVLGSLHTCFAHANIRLAPWLEGALRLIVITPDLHRTHHSVEVAEGNSNFGSIFPFWDRLFGTYAAHPAVPEAELVMGLPKAEKPAAFTVSALLMHPLSSRQRG